MRIDKYLWAVRVFKTRTLASDACKKGRVSIDDFAVKPSRDIKAGDVIKVRKNPVVYEYKVKEILGKRVSAKLAVDYVENITSEEELQKLENDRLATRFYRDKGAGRPTKKERREMDDFFT